MNMNTSQDSLPADAADDGIRFILPWQDDNYFEGRPIKGGLVRHRAQGHLVTLAGRGGTGKSVLALQFLTALLEQSKAKHRAAFYFTLEASPFELALQLRAFDFGARYFPKLGNGDRDEPIRDLKPESLEWHWKDLHIHAIPSPIEDLTVLIRQVRQTIALALADSDKTFDDLVGIVIDPLGGVRNRETLRTDLSGLKHLADSHKTFLFLLAEDHIYEEHRSIEHYSQTVLQLEYEPSKQPSRWIVVQKARSQKFRAGLHQLDLRDSGVTVFPSVEAQSAYAHDLKRGANNTDKAPFLREGFDGLEEIEDGSVIFLMGPPGTFKQYIACEFAGAPEGASSLYISFKADQSSVEKNVRQGKVEDARRFIENVRRHEKTLTDLTGSGEPITWFIDARDPLSTPQEILSDVRFLMTSLPEPRIRRAVVWGLRRLADMPNFSGSTAVRFLEALVTLLRVKRTTCLLVDWPDIEKGNTLPIVDLSQYIFLTRLCHLPDQLQFVWRVLNASGGTEHIKEFAQRYSAIADSIWKPIGEPTAQHAALLRVQRYNEVFYRDLGFRFAKLLKPELGTEPEKEINIKQIKKDFETCWNIVGDRWEKDPSLS